MNRCHISRQYLRDLLDGARGKPKNRKVRDFLEKWKPTIHQGKLYYGDRRIVPYEETEAILKREAEENGMPLSRDGAFHYLKKKYVGFKKRHIIAWLKRVELLQLIHRRPHKETRINTRNREGTANYFMKNNKLNTRVDSALARFSSMISRPRPTGAAPRGLRRVSRVEYRRETTGLTERSQTFTSHKIWILL